MCSGNGPYRWGPALPGGFLGSRKFGVSTVHPAYSPVAILGVPRMDGILSPLLKKSSYEIWDIVTMGRKSTSTQSTIGANPYRTPHKHCHLAALTKNGKATC